MRSLIPAWLAGAVVLLHPFPACAIDTSSLPAADPGKFLALQRSQALLAASTKTNPHPVRILFYGQSITLQEWWLKTRDELRRLFPEANLIIDNRAISGLNASFLIKTAETDVYPFRPDLIFFQAYGPYGAGKEWESLLSQFRARTTADVILLGNHVLSNNELNETTDPALATDTRTEAWVNYVFSPKIARERGFCFPDNRTAWKAYLRANGLPVSALLKDNIHLNAEGSELLFSVVRFYLKVPRQVPQLDPFNNTRVTTWAVGTAALAWTSNRWLRLPFLGNRVDAITTSGARGQFDVRVDGVPPSNLPSSRGHGRVSSWLTEPVMRPALLKVGFEQPPISEKWTLKVTAIDRSDANQFKFSLSGSITGPDGEGDSRESFVSNSRRVTIAPEDWFRGASPGPIGAVVGWTSDIRTPDQFFADVSPGQIGEVATTLINDLADGEHVLELFATPGADLSAIVALRTYHPGGGMPGTERDRSGNPQLRVLPLENRWLTFWPRDGTSWRGFRRSSLNATVQPLTQTAQLFDDLNAAYVSLDEELGFFGLESP
ncbi:MAG TPA: hypothetical protein PLX89_17570 [Verrucomicrobiota bacterium]|nr:hypothetical protein [Verrucomicrobiota bacterium]